MHNYQCPSTFEHATVRPLLKKQVLVTEVFQEISSSFEPSLHYKNSEKVVRARIEHHLVANNLQIYQSASRVHHSKERVLSKVNLDIVTAQYSNSCAVLRMLDMSAAFDVINHFTLVNSLTFSYGIYGDALRRIKFYLNNRYQRVAVHSSMSVDFQLNNGVPQGSVIEPIDVLKTNM